MDRSARSAAHEPDWVAAVGRHRGPGRGDGDAGADLVDVGWMPACDRHGPALTARVLPSAPVTAYDRLDAEENPMTVVRPRLVRPRNDRWIGGVCSGLARRFGTTPTIMRLIFLASCLLPGPQFLIYIALWIVLPNE